MRRRDFVRFTSEIGGAIGLTAIAGGVAADGRSGLLRSRSGRPQELPWVKDPTPFHRRALNLEARLEALSGIITPNERFFVRNHAPTPRIDAESFRLVIEGDGVERRTEVTMRDLVDLPSRSVIAYLDCAGNWRRFFEDLYDRRAQGSQWGTGAVSCAEWTGTPLSNVLELAGLRSGAAHVLLEGVDEGGFSRPLPLERALEPNTLLAYGMNGVELPPDHGFPLRSVVPGWVASSSIKWLGRIVVSTDPIWVSTNTTSYVLIGPEWPDEAYAPALGAPVTEQTIKSALALPWPVTLARGEQTLRGFAYSPHAPIASVEWSEDGGREWHPATVLDPVLRYAWARFELSWSGAPGPHELRVRATDAAGNTQPDTVPFNEKGYLLNVPLVHPIQVA